MSKIKILPDFIANQIAAGEVVQRPESVVKEVIENSIDAEADSVAVVIKDAGKKLIQIIDNGSGIPRDDLELVTKRHATSKIYDQEDLENIKTFGFRGEAVASICSVANVEIITKTENEKTGFRLRAVPGKEDEIEPFGTDRGTQIIVRNLFYNVPARRKFLKSSITEFRYISNTVSKFALANPAIHFILYDDDYLIFDYRPASLQDRVIEVLGPKAKHNIVNYGYSVDYLDLNCFLGNPSLSKRSRQHQYLFLNKRPILNRAINHAVFSAYEHLVEKDKYPVFVIFLEIDPKNVDINVHPQKHEVKFEDEQYIYNHVNRAVLEALNKNNLVPDIDLLDAEAENPFDKVDSGKGDYLVVNTGTGEIIEPKSKSSDGSIGREFHPVNEFQDDRRTPTSKEISAFEEIFGKDIKTVGNNYEKTNINNVNIEAGDVNFADKKYLKLNHKYIITNEENGLIVIDQQKAHRKVLYERFMKAFSQKKVSSQKLLFPVRLDLNNEQLIAFRDSMDDLIKAGFDFSEEEEKLELTAVPEELKAGQEESIFYKLIDSLAALDIQQEENHQRFLCIELSRKFSIRHGDKLSDEEAASLLGELFNCSNPKISPEGGVTYLNINISRFEEKFS